MSEVERFYQGERGQSGCRVWVAETGGPRPLPGRTSAPLSSYSWGRSSFTGQELAWAVLFDSTDDRQIADDWYFDFSVEVITRLPYHAFCLAARDVIAWLDDVDDALQAAQQQA
jgi:hypothetical protein